MKLWAEIQKKRIEPVTTYIDTNVSYPQIKDKPSSVFGFLLVAGYLKAVKTEVAFAGDYMCELAVPNREISFAYKKEILERMSRMIPHGVAMDVHIALYVCICFKPKADWKMLRVSSGTMNSGLNTLRVGSVNDSFHGFEVGRLGFLFPQ